LSRVEVTSELTNLSLLARTVASQLSETNPNRDVSFNIDDNIVVEGDPELLCSALRNLIDNAWKFTSGKQRALIEFGAAEINCKRTFFVRDNGAGFRTKDAEKIFLPFSRLCSAGESDGTGIGLATVKRIVELHGGCVWAEGEPDKGATFCFTIGQTFKRK